jgi:membrane protein involved in colicin uptake
MPLLIGLFKFLANLVLPLLMQEYFKERAERRKEAMKSKGASDAIEAEAEKIADATHVDDILNNVNKRYGPGDTGKKG